MYRNMKRILISITFFNLIGLLYGQGNFVNATYPYGNMPDNTNETTLINGYNSWKSNFLDTCANDTFRVKFDDPDFTVSEGIAYGMLLAAYADDQVVFDGLWNYYVRFMNDNDIMNWKIEGCTKIDGSGGATDAELDATIALMVADKRFGNDGSINYENAAKNLINAIKENEVEAETYVLKPGDQWGGSQTTNPSYFATGYFKAYGEYTNDIDFWNNVANKCYEIIDNNLTEQNAVYNLVSDWCSADGSYASEVSSWAYDEGRSYYYDAARTPWRIAMDFLWYGTNDALPYLNLCNDFVENEGGFGEIYPGYNQDGTPISTDYHDVVFTGAYAVAAMSSDNQDFINQGYTEVKNLTSSGYFGATLRMIYLYALTGNSFNPLQEIVVSNAKNKIPAFQVYPNPVTDQIIVKFSSPAERNSTLSIFDISGKVVAQKKIKANANDTELNLSSLDPGIYTIEVNKTIQKFVKKQQ